MKKSFILDLPSETISNIAQICVADSAASKPNFIFWYHNERMVNYDTQRGVRILLYKLAP